MDSKGDMASGSVLAAEQSMRGHGITGSRMDMAQRRMRMEVRVALNMPTTTNEWGGKKNFDVFIFFDNVLLEV